jgi:hypothetical protein
MTRTFPPTSAWEATSSSIVTTESSVSGFQPSVTSRSPGKICHREPSSSSTTWLSEWDRIFIVSAPSPSLAAILDGTMPSPFDKAAVDAAHVGRDRRSCLQVELAAQPVGNGFDHDPRPAAAHPS